MRAHGLNCTLKRSPDDSNTAALTWVALEALEEHGVETELLRVADHVVEPGVVSEPVSDRYEWPALHEKVLAAEILIVATPTWLGQPLTVAKQMLERMDAMLSETRDDGPPVPTRWPASWSPATRMERITALPRSRAR
jgi:multimeric flavodoxin WrbA